MNELAFRQVHLDFHTSPLIPDVGVDFDPAEFAATLTAAAVNSVTVFAKCHHGLSYYPTRVGVMHPHLKRDLLGEMIEACRRHGIRVPVYLSVVWDEQAAASHADWLQVDQNGRLAGRPPFGDRGWRMLCLNSPYADHIAAQTEEVCRQYDIDGLFMDIVFQTRPGCVCNHCLRRLAEWGLRPDDEADLAESSLRTARGFMQRISELAWRLKPGATVFYNSRIRIAGRAEAGLRPEMPWYSHIEIESLPSGLWGYLHFPLLARYCATLGKEMLGMTARFHKSWADFGGLKNRAALEYECFHALALGAKCSIGDQLHPRGRLEKAVYDRIGEVYRQVVAKEPWCAGATALAEIGVLTTEAGAFRASGRVAPQSDEGAARMLMELHHQFHVIDVAVDFAPYALLIAPDHLTLDEMLAARLSDYLRGGGRLLLSHESGLTPDRTRFALDQVGARYLGPGRWAPHYIRVEAELSREIEPMPHVMYEGYTAVAPEPEATVLGWVGRPYFNRTWEHFTSHAQTPFSEMTDAPAVIERGSVIYISSAPFSAYRRHGNRVYKTLVRNCLDRLLPMPLARSASLPSSGHLTVTQQGRRRVAHLLCYVPERRAEMDIIEDVLPLRDLDLAIRCDRNPTRVYLAPQEKDLSFTLQDGYARCVVPEVRGHQMVVIE